MKKILALEIEDNLTIFVHPYFRMPEVGNIKLRWRDDLEKPHWSIVDIMISLNVDELKAARLMYWFEWRNAKLKLALASRP